MGRLQPYPDRLLDELPAVTADDPESVAVARAEEGAYLPLTIDVLRVTGGAITEIVTFHADRFPALGLPERLPADAAE